MTPTLLLILDGWGLAEPGPGNAPFVAATPNMDALNARCPHSRLVASGRDVGLPRGYMGNSEVGHLNIGAGRVVYQDFTRVTKSIRDGEFFENPTICAAVDKAVGAGKAVHILGLLWRGRKASADGPYRLIGNYCIGKSLNYRNYSCFSILRYQSTYSAVSS